MERLIGDLLDLAEIDAGQLRIERRPCDAASIVEEVVDGLRLRAKERQLQLHACGERDLHVDCDRDRVAQILSNLVTNALKFTKSGTVVARAESCGGDVRFAVTDTGPGIDDASLPKIWRRFWRRERSAGGGVGLGLSIARSLVTAHGGSIWAESKVGVGTTFYFTLPRQPPRTRTLEASAPADGGTFDTGGA